MHKNEVVGGARNMLMFKPFLLKIFRRKHILKTILIFDISIVNFNFFNFESFLQKIRLWGVGRSRCLACFYANVCAHAHETAKMLSYLFISLHHYFENSLSFVVSDFSPLGVTVKEYITNLSSRLQLHKAHPILVLVFIFTNYHNK
jgi:hypothetical protein